MGFTSVEVKIFGEKGSETLKLLAGTGSLLTWIPRKIFGENWGYSDK